MLKTYAADFFGRKVGAIGITYHQHDHVQAENEEKARLALYEKYEHISRLQLTVVPEPEQTK